MKKNYLQTNLILILVFSIVVIFSTTAKSQCTQFIGYSQTNNWYGEFETVMGSAQSQYQLLWNSGGAMAVWQNPAYAGWNNAPVSPCTSNSAAPTRVMLDVTHNQYLTTANVGPDPVAFMDTILRNVIATTMLKYPSVTEIILKPVVGAPNHSDSCYSSYPDPAYNEVPEVRASYNHPIIYSAILLVVANPPVGITVTLGPDTHVGNCSQYINTSGDYHGHLTQAGQDYVAPVVANFFLAPTTAILNDNNLLSNVSVYPNPATTSVSIIASEAKQSLTIYSALGEKVGSWQLISGTNTLDISTLQSGFYFYEMKNGKSSATQKLVVVK